MEICPWWGCSAKENEPNVSMNNHKKETPTAFQNIKTKPNKTHFVCFNIVEKSNKWQFGAIAFLSMKKQQQQI